MIMKDYYQILGISENATDDQIKQAYKRLAKQYHPDRNPGNAKFEEKFKEMSEAYNVLSDPKKRKEYDSMRRFGGRQGFATSDADFDWRDFMKDFRSQAQGFGQSTSFSDIFDDMFFGSGRTRQKESEVEIRVPFLKAVRGGDVEFQYNNGNVRTLRVRLPEGIADGEKIRVNPVDGPSVLVTVRVQPDNSYSRKGQDIYFEVRLNMAQLILGTSIRVNTVYDNQVDVKIPPGTQPGTVLKLGGLGVKGKGKKGDMFVTVHASIPKHLTRKQRELLEEFAREVGLKY